MGCAVSLDAVLPSLPPVATGPDPALASPTVLHLRMRRHCQKATAPDRGFIAGILASVWWRIAFPFPTFWRGSPALRSTGTESASFV